MRKMALPMMMNSIPLFFSHTDAPCPHQPPENRKGPDGRVAATEVDEMDAEFAKPKEMRPKKRTQKEKSERLFAWGRKGTHKSLEKANKDHSERPRNDEGNVAATKIDDTPQRARFAQTKPPKKKHLTDKEKMNKDAAYGRTGNRKVLKSAREAHDKKKGPDGKVPTTEIDEEVEQARFAQARGPRPRKRTQAEQNARRFGPAGRKDTHRVLGKANLAYNDRPRNDDGNVRATAFDDTPMKARFAQPRKSDARKNGKERRKEAGRSRGGYARNDMRRAQLLAKLEYEERRNAEPKLRDIDTAAQAKTPTTPRYKPAGTFAKALSDVDEGSEGGEAGKGEGGGDEGEEEQKGKERGAVAAAGDVAKEGEIAPDNGGPNAAGGGGPTVPLDDNDGDLDSSGGGNKAPKLSIRSLEAEQGEAPGLKI